MKALQRHPADVNLSNWQSPPFSEWAFQNVCEIVSSARIEAGPGDSLPLPQEHRALDHFRLESANRAPMNLGEFQEATQTDALIVVIDGRIAYEFYDHGMTPTTRHILMSASKSIVGLIVGILLHRGSLDLDEQISRLLPEVAHTGYRSATFRHVLDMRTGVRLSPVEQATYEAATNWVPLQQGAQVTDLRAFFTTLQSRLNPHGGPFSYVSANTDLLGWALERASGKSIAALVTELLWKPMGAECGAYVTVDRGGLARCTGGFCMTARDLARIGQLLVDGGRHRDREVIPEAWIDDIAGNGDRQAWKNGEFAKYFPYETMSYRSGWYVIHDEPQILFAMGIYGQNLFVDRANRLVIAKLSSHKVPLDYAAIALTHQAVQEIRRCLIGGPRRPLEV